MADSPATPNFKLESKSLTGIENWPKVFKSVPKGRTSISKINYRLALQWRTTRIASWINEFDASFREANCAAHLHHHLEPCRLSGVVHQDARLLDFADIPLPCHGFRKMRDGGLSVRRIEKHAPVPILLQPVPLLIEKLFGIIYLTNPTLRLI